MTLRDLVEKSTRNGFALSGEGYNNDHMLSVDILNRRLDVEVAYLVEAIVAEFPELSQFSELR